ncbi:MAG: sensor histidine kinase [Janthinobacterium lividum]
MSDRSVRSLVPLALFAALLIVGLNTWFAVSAVRSLLDSERWLSHTWEVIGQNDHLMVSVSNAESAARGFVITGKESVLGTFQESERALPQEVQRFKALSADNLVQQANIAEAEGIIVGRMDLLRQLITTRRSGGFEAAQAVANTGRGATESAKLRTIIARMDMEERRLLLDRAETARRDGRRVFSAIGLACVLDLLMIAFVTFYFVEERTLRLASQEDAERIALARAQAERSAEEVRILNAELEGRVRERTAELEATNRELEAFSYSVSHDLRAPLRTIDGFSLALQEDYAEAVDAVGRDYIQRVRTGVQRMGQLIDSLLQLSRITRAEVSREPVNVAKLAESVAANLQEENQDRNLSFHITSGPEQTADPKLVQVALENLLGNAVKFTARVPVAEISFGWDAEASAWRVSDNGAGFDMHYAHKLFNAFNRLHGDKDFKGSGIGLATVARVVRRHGGRIWASSTVDHGASFWFTLG